ncbi:MAG TPA: class I SAM-dependent methyltransferase [Acidimicrobiia bacterium]
MSGSFYGADQAAIHDAAFGDLAARAAERLTALLHDAGLRAGTVVDLGCGSGILAEAMAAEGYDVAGVDLSPAMIDLARARVPSARLEVGSIYDYAIPQAVGIAAIGEVLNYATDQRAGSDALDAIGKRAFDALVPGGAFVLDIATPGRLGGATTLERFHDHPGWALHMHAVESTDDLRLERQIVIFTAGPDGNYRRTDEHHVLQLYTPEDVLSRLRATGFEARVESLASASPPPSGWIFVVARRPPA